jgi:hypothetical protein
MFRSLRSRPRPRGTRRAAMRALALAATLMIALLASHAPARADIYPPLGGPIHPRHDAEAEWKRLILLLDGGFGFPIGPADFQRYWNPDDAFGIGLSVPIGPALDFVARSETYKMKLDAGHFREDFGALPQPGDHDAWVSPLLLLLRLHPGREGYRPFVDAGLGIMDVSRPALFYYDGGGQFHTIEGAEIFALDPCYSLGVGFECTWYRRMLGGAVEARAVTAPGRTEPPHTIATLRAGLQITIPKWLGGR